MCAALIAGAGGVGLALYALAWAVVPVAPESRGRPRRPGAWREAAADVLAVVACCGRCAARPRVRLSRSSGPPSSGSPAWRSSGGRSERSGAGPDRRAAVRALRGAAGAAALGSPIDVPRVVLGVLMVSFASAALLHHYAVMHSLGKAIGAVALVTVVVALARSCRGSCGSWRSLASERSARIREQERAEVAAHLHDSVLQTLALIQKRAADPREVAGLARRQERELRSWLHERPDRRRGGDASRSARCSAPRRRSRSCTACRSRW